MLPPRRRLNQMHPPQQRTRLETDGPERHQEQTVELEAIPPARPVHQLVAQRLRLERDAAPELDIEVLERDRVELGTVERLQASLRRSYGAGMVQTGEIGVEIEGFVVHVFHV